MVAEFVRGRACHSGRDPRVVHVLTTVALAFAPVQAEHKVSDADFSDAVTDLVSKMTGLWNPVAMRGIPFLPCMAAAGNLAQFCAIAPSSSVGVAATLYPLTDRFDMSSTVGRLRVLHATLNVARLLTSLRALVVDPVLELYKKHRRNGGYIEVFETSVTKSCARAPDAVYTCLRGEGRLPCAIEVASLAPLTGAAGTPVKLVLRPVCIETLPVNEAQLTVAIRCVLRALAAFHQRGFVHRDVRWPNVLQLSPTEWLLVDFELADVAGAALPVGAVKAECLPPELVDALGLGGREFAPSGDVFRVGRLMVEWGVRRGVTLSAGALAFAAALCSPTPAARLSAADALDHAWMKQTS